MEGQGPWNSEPAYSDSPLPELWILRATGRDLSVQAVWGRKGLSRAPVHPPSSKQKLMTLRGRLGRRDDTVPHLPLAACVIRHIGGSKQTTTGA